MILISPDKLRSLELTEAGEAPPRFWGLDPLELHDRYWAARGVQVVRPGVMNVVRHGPQLYLLIGARDLLYFDLASVIERMNWLKPGAVRLRILERRGDTYREAIDCDSSNELRAFRRTYHQRQCRTIRVWLTADRGLAEAWWSAGAEHAARRRMKERRGERSRDLALTRPGRVFQCDSADEVDESLALLQRRWRSINDAIDGVYEYSPAVWVHETVRVPPNARLVGPMWIGAGVCVRDDEILVGPGGPPDEIEIEDAVKPFDWRDYRLPAWSIRRSGERIAYRRGSKRAFDIIFALIALVVTLPLYPVIIAAILLEDGWPIFFAHGRQTLGGREFPCLKFRTMCRNAERLKSDLQSKNRCDGPQFFIEDDPRLLRIGKILRRFQLDELPQFWNVLAGDMSVVGPRPSPDRENQFCPTWREARLSVRPGVTGLWQIRRTREPQTDFQEWIRYDLEYVQRQSWRLDFWIILQTIRKALLGEKRHDAAR